MDEGASKYFVHISICQIHWASHRQADDGTFWRAAVLAGCCVAVDVAAMHGRQGGTPPLVLAQEHQNGLVDHTRLDELAQIRSTTPGLVAGST